MKQVRLNITTDTSGAGATMGNVVSGGASVVAIDYFPGSIDTGATVTVTDEFSGASFTVWTKTGAGTSNIRIFPHAIKTLNTDGSALSTHAPVVVCGKPKVAVSSGGGATNDGYVILHLA